MSVKSITIAGLPPITRFPTVLEVKHDSNLWTFIEIGLVDLIYRPADGDDRVIRALLPAAESYSYTFELVDGEQIILRANDVLEVRKRPSGRSKFGNRPTDVDGIHFDSEAEARRYGELRLLVKTGEIADLVCHPRYELQPSFRRDGKLIPAIHYTPDFGYTEDGQVVVEDVKGGSATRTQAFELRRKLFLFRYPYIDLRIVDG